MQWIFMLVGGVLGVLVGESISAGVLGAVLGLACGLALRLQAVERRNAELNRALGEFAERFERGTTAIHERLLKVEQAGAPAAETRDTAAAPQAAEVPAVAETAAPGEEAVAEDELSWTLPADEPEKPKREVATEPAAADAWADKSTDAHHAAPRAPAQPRQPSTVSRLIAAARAWLLGGNTLLRVGVLLLFLGLAFLLRYATEGVVLPVALRYAAVAAGAIALLGLGWWLRRRNPSYALVLQGTGIAVLYLTVFAAMRLHPLLDPGMAFALLLLVTLCSAILAVIQDALGLAAAAALGGFAAPILTSTGSGDHVALFSYFALLNAGIFAIAWFKAWRLLNLIGFVGTFGIGFAWGMRSYTPELLGSTQPFLLLFFVMYLGIGLLFARRKLREAAEAPSERGELLHWSLRQGDYVDATALLGPPLVGFGLQLALVRHIEFAAAYSALALGLLYLGLARLLAQRGGARLLLLMEGCLALGVVFATLAIPLALDARWTSAAWAVEGAGIFWLGLRQRRRLARAFALLLQAGAALAFVADLDLGTETLLAGSPLGALMLGAALLFSFRALRAAPEADSSTWERRGLPLLAGAGLAFLYLVAPLCFAAEGTAMAWALAGLATLLIGLRIGVRTLVFGALLVQLLGGGLFLTQLSAGSGGLVFAAGWRGLLTASLIGLAMIGAMLLAVRDRQIAGDRRLLLGLSLVLLAGLALLNLAVLFVLPWASAAAVWGASGLLILWLSLHGQQRAGFFFGLLLQGLGGLAFLLASPLLHGSLDAADLRPLAHGGFWTPAILGLAALLGAWRLQRPLAGSQQALLAPTSLGRLSQLLLVWGAAWWSLSLVAEVLRFAPAPQQPAFLLLAAAASVALWTQWAQRAAWRGLALLCTLLVPAAALILLLAWRPDYHPAAHLGGLAWLALFVVQLRMLRLLAQLLPAGALSAAHVLGCWLLLAVLSLELRYGLYVLAEHYNAWRWLGWALLPSAYLWLMAAWAPAAGRPWPWPLAAHVREYRLLAAAPLALLMLLWFWLACLFSDGAAEPLVYLPLLNPLELGLLISLGAICLWLRGAQSALGLANWCGGQLPQLLGGASLFLLLTTAVLRTAHQWGGVPYRAEPLFESMQVQAGLSLVWTLIALALMVAGHLRLRRELWLVGAALIAVVVAKLFVIELGNRGGLERIVSFIGVGLLLLVVGYFAPLPPRPQQVEQEPVQS